MTTVSQIITDAYRQSNLLAIGTLPTVEQQEEGLRYLNRIVKSVFGNEIGEPLHTVDIPFVEENDDFLDDLGVNENVRLLCNLSSPSTVKLPMFPQDGTRFAVVDIEENFDVNSLTIDARGRKIEDVRSLVLDEPGFTGEWIYRDELGEWVKILPLALDDPFPFGEEFDMYFITMVAMSINPAYGIAMNDQSLSLFNRAKSQLRTKYQQTNEARVDPALLRMPKVVRGRDTYGYRQAKRYFDAGFFW